MSNLKTLGACAAFVCLAAPTAPAGSIRNGGFDGQITRRTNDESVVAAVKAGWTLPSDLLFPSDWVPNPATPNGSLDYRRSGGWLDSPYVRLDGMAHISSYFGPAETGKPYVGSIKVRGKGAIYFGLYLYGADGFMGGAAVVERSVDTGTGWREYRGVFPNDNPRVGDANPAIGARGPLDVDDVTFAVAEPADTAIVREMAKLYDTGALVEDLSVQAVVADKQFADAHEEYRKARATYGARKQSIERQLTDSFDRKIASLEPILSGDRTMILASAFNDMVCLTKALNLLSGQAAGGTKKVSMQSVVSPGYKPGERSANPDTVTVLDIRSNKVRYDENETASTRVTVINSSDTPWQGTLVATMRLDLDDARELARTPMTLAPHQTRDWSFGYSVGPETYGRAIEVACVGPDGKTADVWQEYYAVAAEWFRVQQHAGAAQMKTWKSDFWTTYYNQEHNFACEPTDWGVQTDSMKDLGTYLSGQALYNCSVQGRRDRYAWLSTFGVMGTFYQTFDFCGQMGYEVMRQHPEFALYDANGQFAVDPVYGGYPNPMEVASPMETGPTRKVIKPYLDRKLSAWGHGVADFASEDALVFMTECIKKQAEFLHCAGIYIDGNVGVFKGYAHDGHMNVPSGKREEAARLNARNHRVFSQLLKSDNPNFGTWYNWSAGYYDWGETTGSTANLGGGDPRDVGDATIRAAAGWKNVMFLMEQCPLSGRSENGYRPANQMKTLLDNRDYVVQKYKANAITGYMFLPTSIEEPGASRWAWPTVNYYGAELIASQHHFAGGFVPSLRPTFQFMARFSRYIWAPDVQALPENQKTVSVKSPEELWWTRTVYRRANADGYDLIVHLVRIPPFEFYDPNWLDDPKPLSNVTVTVRTETGRVVRAYACRPYYYEEPQQVIQQSLKPTEGRRKTTVTIPPFRYHTMLVFRVTAGRN